MGLFGIINLHVSLYLSFKAKKVKKAALVARNPKLQTGKLVGQKILLYNLVRCFNCTLWPNLNPSFKIRYFKGQNVPQRLQNWRISKRFIKHISFSIIKYSISVLWKNFFELLALLEQISSKRLRLWKYFLLYFELTWSLIVTIVHVTPIISEIGSKTRLEIFLNLLIVRIINGDLWVSKTKNRP